MKRKTATLSSLALTLLMAASISTTAAAAPPRPYPGPPGLDYNNIDQQCHYVTRTLIRCFDDGPRDFI